LSTKAEHTLRQRRSAQDALEKARTVSAAVAVTEAAAEQEVAGAASAECAATAEAAKAITDDKSGPVGEGGSTGGSGGGSGGGGRLAAFLQELGLESHLATLEAQEIDMATLEALAFDDGEDRLRSVLVGAGLLMGPAVKISRALKQASVSLAKSAAIDEANRDRTAAAVRLHEQERQMADFHAEAGRLRAAAAIVPNKLECPISMEIMVDPVIAADGHTCE
jgi:hypothetical protein